MLLPFDKAEYVKKDNKVENGIGSALTSIAMAIRSNHNDKSSEQTPSHDVSKNSKRLRDGITPPEDQQKSASKKHINDEEHIYMESDDEESID